MDSILLALVTRAVDEQRKSRIKFNDAVVNTTESSKRIGSGGFPSSSSPLTEQQAAVVIYMMAILSKHVVYDETKFNEIVERAKDYGGLNFWWYGFIKIEEVSRQSLIRFIYGCYKIKSQEDKVKKDWLIEIATFLIKKGYKGNADDAHVCGAHCSTPTFGLDVGAKFEETDDIEAYELWLTKSSENFVNNFYDQNDYLKPF
jgi:hypothetical protein